MKNKKTASQKAFTAPPIRVGSAESVTRKAEFAGWIRRTEGHHGGPRDPRANEKTRTRLHE